MQWSRAILASLLLAVCASSAVGANVDEFIVWNYYAGGAGDTTVDLYGRLYVPPDYDPAVAYPLVVFFHGLGEGGTDNVRQVNGNIDNLFNHCKQRVALLYAPQSASGWWPDTNTDMAMAKVAETLTAYNVDPSRVYVTGLSAGGGGVFNAMEKHDDVIAAGVAVCAASGGWQSRADVLVGKPLWLYHAADDGTVSVSQSRQALNSIRSASGFPTISFPLDTDPEHPCYNTGEPYYTDGSTYYEQHNLRYTEYDTGGHGIWGRVYNEEWMYDWLFGTVINDAINAPPEVDAGTDISSPPPDDTVALTGSATDDGRPVPPNRLTFTWSKVSGAGDVTFASTSAVTTTATFSMPGTYVLRLTADDGELQSHDDVTVHHCFGPRIEYDAADLGDGLIGWTFYIANDDALLAPYVVALAFEGSGEATIHQVAYNGVMPIHTETLATVADGGGTPPYVKARDTWVFSPFGDNTLAGVNPLTGSPLTGFYEATDAFALSCYSGPDSMAGDAVPVAYVVADGNVLWAGTITREGVEYDTIGLTEQSCPGDYNGDGEVTGADYVVWADTFGNDGSPGNEDLRADGNGDGAVTGADYVIWAEHFGQ